MNLLGWCRNEHRVSTLEALLATDCININAINKQGFLALHSFADQGRFDLIEYIYNNHNKNI